MVDLLSTLVQYGSDYTSSYSNSSSTASAGEAVAIFAILGAIYIPLLIIGIVGLVGMWKTFVKAGKPGWAAIVPVYNGMVLAEIAGRPTWWGLGFLISPLSLVVSIVFGLDIAKRFHKSDVFGVVGLGLFSFVGYCMLGFGNSVYDKDATPTYH